MYGNTDILKKLAANGADLHVKEIRNDSLLHLAADQLDDQHLMKCLYFGEKFNFSDKEYQETIERLP